MDSTIEKVALDSRKIYELANVINDRLAGFYPVDWQIDSLDAIQNLMLVLTDQVSTLRNDMERLELETRQH